MTAALQHRSTCISPQNSTTATPFFDRSTAALQHRSTYISLQNRNSYSPIVFIF
jgi:hypothetical protein